MYSKNFNDNLQYKQKYATQKNIRGKSKYDNFNSNSKENIIREKYSKNQPYDYNSYDKLFKENNINQINRKKTAEKRSNEFIQDNDINEIKKFHNNNRINSPPLKQSKYNSDFERIENKINKSNTILMKNNVKNNINCINEANNKKKNSYDLYQNYQNYDFHKKNDNKNSFIMNNEKRQIQDRNNNNKMNHDLNENKLYNINNSKENIKEKNIRKTQYDFNEDTNNKIKRYRSYNNKENNTNKNYNLKTKDYLFSNNYTNKNNDNFEKSDFTGYFVNKYLHEHNNEQKNINESKKNKIEKSHNLNYDYNKRNNNDVNFFNKKAQVNNFIVEQNNIKQNKNNSNNNWNNNAFINNNNNHFNRENRFNRNNNNIVGNKNINNFNYNNYFINNRNNAASNNHIFNNNNLMSNNNNNNFNFNNNNMGFQNVGNIFNNRSFNNFYNFNNLRNNNFPNNFNNFNYNLNQNFNYLNQNMPSFNNWMNMNIPINNNAQFNQRSNSFNLIQNNQTNNNQGHKRSQSSSQIGAGSVYISKKHANGLVNVGATCYMNATLQCLANIEHLTKTFLMPKNINLFSNNKLKYRLSYSFMEVLKNLWQNNIITSYSPNNFKDIISQMNPLFEGVKANDSKDLVIFLMENMHNELNIPKNINIQNQNFNQYDYENTFNLFSNYFTNHYRSVISNVFYGMHNSMMTCFSCKNTTHNVQCFNILIFPLEEVRKFKNNFYNFVDIIDCFQFYQKEDLMTGDNQIYCNFCRRMTNSCNSSKLIIAPNVLVINLNRGKGLQFDVKLTFQEYLNIKNFVYYNNSPNYYELIGIVTHFGPSNMGGHFIAFCKSFVDHNWYKYNDAQVTNSSFSEASTVGVPYILFYSVIKS